MKQHSGLRVSAMALLCAGTTQLALAVPASLPEVQHAGVISYLSGGVGSDQSAEMKGEMHNYPLVLEFAGKTNAGNDYLADIPVQISDAHGTVLVDTNARGPFMLVSLPDGRYAVTARYKGTQQRRVVNVATGVHEHEAFIWPM